MSHRTASSRRRIARAVAPAPYDRTLLTLEAAELPPNLDIRLLNAMSLRVPKRGGTERLTGPEVERALLSGEHARTLETYFGEAEYQELRQLAARATRRTREAGPRVLILPGILGSMLAQVNGAKTDTLWVDFLEIALGRLNRLALPGVGRQFRAVDVHLATYLKLKLWLQGEGFDADFHPFDWRQSIPDLGRQLAERIEADPAGEIFLVAHSMGGLVARAALNEGAEKKVQRLVMLGTPNFGSFAPAMVYRSAYPFLAKIAALDLKHTATDLAGKIFNTHPGLAEMLPQSCRFNAVNLYDLDQWPTSGARPSRPVLAAAPGAQRCLSVLTDKFVMIAGVDRETTVNLRVAGEEFMSNVRARATAPCRSSWPCFPMSSRIITPRNTVRCRATPPSSGRWLTSCGTARRASSPIAGSEAAETPEPRSRRRSYASGSRPERASEGMSSARRICGPCLPNSPLRAFRRPLPRAMASRLHRLCRPRRTCLSRWSLAAGASGGSMCGWRAEASRR